MEELELFLDTLEQPEIILVTEHWLNSQEPLFISNYLLVLLLCRYESVHGGILILVKNCFQNLYSFVNIDKFDHLIEKQFEFSIVHSKKLNVYIIVIYRSPKYNVNALMNGSENILSQIPPSATLILSRDFNIVWMPRIQMCIF